MITVPGLVIAAALGLGMGLLGGGGSIVAVPALTFFLHFPQKDAVATSLVLVGLIAATGAFGAWWRGALPLKVALIVGTAATMGSLGGSVIGARLPDRWQLIALAVVMFVAASTMWRRPVPPRNDENRAATALLVVTGLGVGALTGLLGVGGGFLIVPALVLAARLPMRNAAAASLFVIALSASAALPGYAARATFSWAFIVPFAVIAGSAAIAGGGLAHHLPHRLLQRAFAATLVILGGYVLLQA